MTNQPTTQTSKLGALATATPTAQPNASNSKAAIKAKLLSIVSSLQARDAENEHIKDILGELKAEHGIKPKVGRKAASIMHKQNQAELDEFDREVNELLLQIKQ